LPTKLIALGVSLLLAILLLHPLLLVQLLLLLQVLLLLLLIVGLRKDLGLLGCCLSYWLLDWHLRLCLSGNLLGGNRV
jgi:hypothetical protein